MATIGKSIGKKVVATASTMGAIKSIAGRAHGVKDTVDPNLSKSPKKWYPEVAGLVHPKVEKELREMMDNIYQLRDENRANSAAIAATAASGGGSAPGQGGSSSSSIPESAMATGIHGIRIQPATDPSTLKTGYTLRYNAKTSQFEFGM